MNWIKVIFLNIIITFSLIGMFLLAPPILHSVYSIISKAKPTTTNSSIDKRSELELYNGIVWAEKHFLEFAEISTKYNDFITWRRNDYSGETINIIDGVRVTIGSHKQNNNNNTQYYFFGGSTTWGTGVNDANTYPSLFAQSINVKTFNFGESNYIARQSLSYLNNLIINQSIDKMTDAHVIFYDGVNDVANLCRSEINGLSTNREPQIQKILTSKRKKEEDTYSFRRTFQQLTDFIKVALNKLGFKNIKQSDKTLYYNCSSDIERAQEVAQILVNTWEVTSRIVTQRGGTFTAILQPVAFIGNPNIEYLDFTSDNYVTLASQYKTVYPLIKKIVEKKNINFLDFTDIYDGCNNCYIDDCHVGPDGHKLLVEHLVQNLT